MQETAFSHFILHFWLPLCQCILGTQTFALHDFTCKAFSLGCHQAIRGSIAFKFQVHGDWPASAANMFVVPCLWLAPGQQICVCIQDAACARAELDTRSFCGTSRATDMFIPCNYPGTTYLLFSGWIAPKKKCFIPTSMKSKIKSKNSESPISIRFATGPHRHVRVDPVHSAGGIALLVPTRQSARAEQGQFQSIECLQLGFDHLNPGQCTFKTAPCS